MRAMTWRRQVTWSFPEAWQYWYLTADAAVAAEYCPEATRSLARARNLNRDFADVLDVEGRLEALWCS
jgi:predicted fused transcriptional regulator/phosphomethylpyrimidine kinase